MPSKYSIPLNASSLSSFFFKKKAWSLLLMDVFLLTNAFILSKFVFDVDNIRKLFMFNQWLVLILIICGGMLLTRAYNVDSLTSTNIKKIVLRLILILLLEESLRLGCGLVSGLRESLVFSVIAFSFMMTYRLSFRLSFRLFSFSPNLEGSPKHTLIKNNAKKQHSPNKLLFGAGEAGEDYLKNEKQHNRLKHICGVLDDDLSKKGKYIEGVPILGSFEDCLSYIYSLDIGEIIICVEKISASRLGNIIDKIDANRVRVKIIPAVKETLDAKKQVTFARNISAEDLLGRNSIILNNDLIKKSFEGKKVLITGAGGSIGSEICHQLLSYPIKRLMCVSRSEFSLYKLEETLTEENTQNIEIVYALGDVRDTYSLETLFKDFRPDVVFHAAAHKHVPYMEVQEKEAIKNNVIGTDNVLKVSQKYNIGKFILVSTDKAVNPGNVMGASKRLAEILTESYFQLHELNTAIVRFGNVLGSKGSVVPLFTKQILEGGPITVTDPNVVRYFMTIPEAALLVINCGALSKGGEKFILDMGKPIKIDDLVRKLIRLYGFKPDEEIQINYTGLRPGEKLIEELMTESENVEKTINKKIFVSNSREKISLDTLTSLNDLTSQIESLNSEAIRKRIKAIVPGFTGHAENKQ